MSDTQESACCARPERQQSSHGFGSSPQARAARPAPRTGSASASPAPRSARVSSVFRSARHIRAQVVDDTTGRTLAAASTEEKELRRQGGNVVSAAAVGRLVAERAKAAGVKRSCSIGAASATTAGWPRLPTPPEKKDWSSDDA